MERSHSRLQTELDRCKDKTQTQLDFRENRFHFDQQEQMERLTAELGSLQKTHNTLRLFSLQTLALNLTILLVEMISTVSIAFFLWAQTR